MANPADLLLGTLDVLILNAVSRGKLHGYGVLPRIEQISKYSHLTRAGRKRLGEETASWNRLAEAIARSLAATPQGA